MTAVSRVGHYILSRPLKGNKSYCDIYIYIFCRYCIFPSFGLFMFGNEIDLICPAVTIHSLCVLNAVEGLWVVEW